MNTWPMQYINKVSNLSLPSTFNPWRDHCLTHDLEDAVERRRHNLHEFLSISNMEPVEAVWFGRDLGYRGGRRTGIALTDEYNIPVLAQSSGLHLLRSTIGLPTMERTATEIWSVIKQLPKVPFLWNVFPLHPHEPGQPFTNRAHTRAEARICSSLTIELLGKLNPKIVISLGNDAYRALSEIGIDSVKVRHPSYGGQAEFKRDIQKLYPTAIFEAKDLSQLKLF